MLIYNLCIDLCIQKLIGQINVKGAELVLYTQSDAALDKVITVEEGFDTSLLTPSTSVVSAKADEKILSTAYSERAIDNISKYTLSFITSKLSCIL